MTALTPERILALRIRLSYLGQRAVKQDDHPDSYDTEAALGGIANALGAVAKIHQPRNDDPLSLVQHTYCSCGAMEVFTDTDGERSIGPVAYPCKSLRPFEALADELLEEETP